MSTQKFIDIAGNQYVLAVTLVDSSGTSYTAGTSTAPANSTVANVTSSNADSTLLASNSARKGAIIYNDSTSVLYILLATGTSSTTSYSVQIASQGSLSIRVGEYTGVIKGTWATANGFARVTEFS